MTPASHNKSGILLLLPGVYPEVTQEHIRQAMASVQSGIARALEIPAEAVAYGYLEQGEPALESALETLCAMGLTEIRLIPLLFFPDTLFNRKIPTIIRQSGEKYPGVRIQVGRCLDIADPGLMDLLLKRL